MKKIMTLCFVLLLFITGCGEKQNTTIDEPSSSPYYVVKDFEEPAAPAPKDTPDYTEDPLGDPMVIAEFEFCKQVNDACMSTATTIDNLSMYLNTVDDSSSIPDVQLYVETELQTVGTVLNAVHVIEDYPDGRFLSSYMWTFDSDREAIIVALNNYYDATEAWDTEEMITSLSYDGELYNAVSTLLVDANNDFYPTATNFMKTIADMYP